MHDHAREDDDQRHHDALDDHERDRAPVDFTRGHTIRELARDLVGERLPRRNRAQIEQCKPERRMHERRLHVDAKNDAEPDQIDAEFLSSRSKQRDHDERQLEEVEEEGEQEHHDVHDDQEARLSARQRHQQMLDPEMAVHAVERQREDTCTDQNEHDEGRKLGRRFNR